MVAYYLELLIVDPDIQLRIDILLEVKFSINLEIYNCSKLPILKFFGILIDLSLDYQQI